MQVAYKEINLSALEHNLNIVKTMDKSAKILSMVKADAYGHGLVTCAYALHHSDALGVARLDEAIQIRQVGITTDVVLMEGCFDKQELRTAIAYDFQIAIHNKEQLQLLQSEKLNEVLTVWLKYDSGMCRLGFNDKEYIDAYNVLSGDPLIELRLFTHMACADEPNNQRTSQQINQFVELTHDFCSLKSIANSAVILNGTNGYDWVRPGIMLYGVSPFLHRTGKELGLLPVMNFKTKVIAVKKIKANAFVGYGGRWQSTRDINLAVLAIGYGDGYPRSATNGTPVMINNEIFPLVGTVSMDMITVDLGPTTEVEVGDTATLWGDNLPVEIVARHANTIGYELLTRLTSRVKSIVNL
ncbi:alanine racemase [Colwellia sp. MEBiC06753]